MAGYALLRQANESGQPVANLITIARLPLLLVVVLLLYTSNPVGRMLSILGLGLLILMDTFDGVVARARHEVSLMGSVFDIMVDRTVELVLWIVYADLRLVPVAIPIIFVVRGTVVDALRSLHVGAGTAPFMAMRTTWGRWLVGSPLMRSTYGVSKLLAFTGLALTHTLAAYATQGVVEVSTVHVYALVALVTSWISVALCLARGLPVVLELLPSRSKTREAI
jgi:CDP-diacylglycerol---glycerol-3-phosphate 3-phosphatidyltransferase